MTTGPDDRALLRALFQAALDAASPALCLPPHLPPPPAGRTVVVGAGKAAASMAATVEAMWPWPLEGVVVTRYGHGMPCRRIEVIEAAHPVPDVAGEAAAARILGAVRGLTSEDLVLALISGGGSALLTLPAPGLTLADKQAVNRALLHSGADITAMNTVRRHLSAIKGGRLALAAAPAKVVALVISDVPGDDVATVASGPTVGDPTSAADALAIIARYGIDLPERVRDHLATPDAQTPKPGDPRLAHAETRLIASPQMALNAAARVAKARGLTVVNLGDAIEGEAREVGIVHAGIAHACARHGTPAAPPCVLLSGGETTVTLGPPQPDIAYGRGGRNAEFLLSLAVKLNGHPGIAAIACDTDGIDGSETNAGAVLLPDSMARARAAGLDLAAHLQRHDAFTAFSALGDLVVTGPTLTNVNDFRAILVRSRG